MLWFFLPELGLELKLVTAPGCRSIGVWYLDGAKLGIVRAASA